MPEGLIGTWRLISVYPANINGLHPKEQRKLLGTKITIDADSLAACGQKIEIKSVSTSRIATDDMFFQYHLSFANLGIRDETMLRVVINDNQDGDCLGRLAIPGEEVYLKSHDEICVTLDGVVFKASRIRNARKSAAPPPL
jgi:hypothetical protein